MSSKQRLSKNISVDGYVSAAEASQLLSVKTQTLYSYVSRGLIRSVSQGARKARLYSREDIDRARARADVRSGLSPAAGSALRWGQPVIDTAVSEITPEGPRYRGTLATDLARRGAAFESVAELLWIGESFSAVTTWEVEPLPRAFVAQLDQLVAPAGGMPMLRVFALATTLLGANERVSDDVQRGTTIAAARQLMLMLTGCLGYLCDERAFCAARSGESVTHLMLRSLGTPFSAARLTALNAALVLSADHELSSATFAARVAASTGAELRACVLAAIGAHSGALLGGSCDAVEDQLASGIPATPAGNRVPGFNIAVYPKGDPRAAMLFDLAGAIAPIHPATRQFIADAESRFSLRPSIELGLVTLAQTMALPHRAAGALWAISRAAGWIAHVLEQRRAGYVLRPRARYAGAV